jgi:hypothetical protein
MSDVDVSTRREIDKIVERILRDGGLRKPPIQITDVLEHLKLNRDFCRLDDPTLLRRFAHRLQIGTKKLVNIVRDKIKLAAVWLPDEKRILVDTSQPEPKQMWASFHDSVHTILPWHRDFFLGDTAQSLEHEYQDMLEAEANYGASGLMFGGKVFTAQALDTTPCWNSIEQLTKLHKKSYVTTFRRYIEHSHDVALAGLISTPWWKEKPDDQITRCRHFIRSPAFEKEFPNVHPDQLLDPVNNSTKPRKWGIAGEFMLAVKTVGGDQREFFAESFFNQHYLMTLFVAQSRGQAAKVFV